MSMDKDDSIDEDPFDRPTKEKILDDAAKMLMRHFDSVQIICTMMDPNGTGTTSGISSGAGNWYARYGSTKDWVERQEEEFRNPNQ